MYASISASGLVAGSGYHVMARDQIDDDDHGPELVRLVAQAEKQGLEIWGESLATAPRGYRTDHPRIDLLRRKSLSLGAALSFDPGISRTDGVRFVGRTWRAAASVTGWLDAFVGASTLPTGRPRRRR